MKRDAATARAEASHWADKARIRLDAMTEQAAEIAQLKGEWTQEDWADFYHGLAFGLWKICQRHKRKPKQLPLEDYSI